MKEFAELTKPDPRNRFFARLNAAQGSAKPLTLEYYYECTAAIRLNAGVPDDVHNYMETVKSLFVYGWYYYPFCTVAGSLSMFVIEMALRIRMRIRARNGPRLRGLLDRALKQGLIQKKWASRMDQLERWEFAWNLDTSFPEEFSHPVTSILEGSNVARQTVKMRNSFAHGEFEPVSFPRDALQIITVASEVINQLWPLEKKG